MKTEIHAISNPRDRILPRSTNQRQFEIYFISRPKQRGTAFNYAIIKTYNEFLESVI